jgi:hypothetical protein
MVKLKMFNDEDHEPDCDCFGCSIRTQAQRCKSEQIIDDWAIPFELIELLAEHLIDHVAPADHLGAIDRYARDLRIAVNRLRPELGAAIIPICSSNRVNRRNDDGTVEATPSSAVRTDSADPHQHIRQVHPSDSAVQQALPNYNVALLSPQNRSESDRRPRRGNPIHHTMTIAATAELDAQALDGMTIEVLHHLWWSCQAWSDITTPGTSRAQTIHTGFASRAYQNQHRIAAELERRKATIPTAPAPGYITAIRTDQAFG